MKIIIVLPASTLGAGVFSGAALVLMIICVRLFTLGVFVCFFVLFYFVFFLFFFLVQRWF